MSEDRQNFEIPNSHYYYLILWGGSMFLACTPGFGLLWGILFLFVFFLVTTFKVLKKLILIFILTFIVGGFLINIFGDLAAKILVILPIISIVLKINFLRKNWKALRLGFFAYFGYIAIMLICGTTMPVIGMFIGALIFTAIFHKLLLSLYREGYDTTKAFSIIGLTPIIVISFLLPFLKIDIEGIEIFQGSATDYASINIHESVVDLPEDVRDTMKLTHISAGGSLKASGIDISEMLNIPTFSHALEASFATSAVYGIFKVESYEKECTVRNKDGTAEIISPVDEIHSVIKDNYGNLIGDIYFDKENKIEVIKLANGFIYSINQATGDVLDAEGKILGKIIDGINDTKLLKDNNGVTIRKFKADGKIFDANNNKIGYAVV